VSFSEGTKYFAEGAYLASNRWNKIVSMPHTRRRVLNNDISM